MICPFSLPRLVSPSATAVTQEQGVKAASLTLCISEARGGLLKHRPLDPTPTVSDSVGLGAALENAFLTNSQWVPKLQSGDQSEN